MKVIPINKVIREIENIKKTEFTVTASAIADYHKYYILEDKVIQIIKDNIKEVSDNKLFDKIVKHSLHM